MGCLRHGHALGLHSIVACSKCRLGCRMLLLLLLQQGLALALLPLGAWASAVDLVSTTVTTTTTTAAMILMRM